MAHLTDLELLEMVFTDASGAAALELAARGYELIDGELD